MYCFQNLIEKLAIPHDITWAEIRKNLAAELKINEDWDKIGIAKVICAGVDPLNVLDIPELSWDKVSASDETTSRRC